MDRDEQRRKPASSLPTSLHNHLYPMPPLRSTAAGGQLSDEPASSSDTEVPVYEAGEGPSHTTPQPFRSGHYPPSSMSLPPTTMYETGSAGSGSVASTGRGEVTTSSSSVGRQHPIAMTSIGRSYDSTAEAGRSSEHHDYHHPPYPTPLRSSYTRTQPPPASLYNAPPTASPPTFYQSETFTYPPPAPPSHREQQHQQHQQQHTSLPPAWQTREPDTGPTFQRLDFESFVNPSRQDDWRTVTAEESRAGQQSTPYDPRNRYAGQELQYAPQYWQQQYEPTYLDPAASARYQQSRPEYRADHYQFDTFPVERRPPSVAVQENRLAGPSSSRSNVYHLPQQSVYPQSRGISEHDREAVFATQLPPFSSERPHAQSTPASQAASSYGERLSGLRYTGPTTGEDPLGLQSLAIQPPTLNYPQTNQPSSRQDEDDVGTDHSAEKETTIDHRSEAGETSSSLGKRRTGTGPESEGAEDEDSPRPKKVSKKTPIACNFCRGRKLKCDGQTPTCRNCDKRSLPCEYALYPRRRGPGKAPKGSKKHAKSNLLRASSDFTLAPVGRGGRPRGTIDTLPEYSATAGMGVTVLDPGPPPPGISGSLGTSDLDRQQQHQQQFQPRAIGQQVVFPVEPWVDSDRTAGGSSSGGNRGEYGTAGRGESDLQMVPPMRQEGEQQFQQQQQQPHGHEGQDGHEQRHERPHDTSGVYKFIQEGFPPPPSPPPG